MPDPKKSGLSDNSLGAIAYLTVLPAIFLLAVPPYSKKASVRFHAWQSIVLFVMAFTLCFVLSFFPVLNTFLESLVYLGLYVLISIVWILVSILYAFSALNGKRVKLPFFGAWAEQQSSK
jgi:uncharacterized membrane protein